MNLPQLRVDHANHFIYGNLIFTVLYFVFLATPFKLYAKDLAAIGTAAFGFAKEGLDAFLNYRITGSYKQGPHGVELKDALATSAGGIVIWINLRGM